MNTLGPLILLGFGFGLLLTTRVVILLVLQGDKRSGSRQLVTNERPIVIGGDFSSDNLPELHS